MKDYTLSEMIEECKKQILEFGTYACVNCKASFYPHCPRREWKDPNFVKLEPRDMVELPCVNVATISPFGKEIKLYEVHYRDNKTNAILTKICKTEPEAGEFLEELKGENHGD